MQKGPQAQYQKKKSMTLWEKNLAGWLLKKLSINIIMRNLSKRKGNIYPLKDIYTDFHDSINSTNLEIIQIFIN